MLQNIRDRIQSWVTWVIIVLLVVAFSFWGLGRFMGMGSNDTKTVAKVDGMPITQSQLNTRSQRLQRQRQMQLGAKFVLNPKTAEKLKQQALKRMITDILLAHAAVKQGYCITQSQINTVLSSMPAFQVNGSFSRERFMQILSQLLYTESSFIEQLRREMLQNQVGTGFVNSSFVFPQDINNIYKLINQRRDIAYLVIPYRRFSKGITITEQQQKVYYNEHKSEFQTPEQVRIAYLELSLNDLKKQSQPTEQQIKEYYQNNLDNYTRPARWAIAHILIHVPANATTAEQQKAKQAIDSIAKQLAAGVDFAKLAKEKSDDMSTAKKGGVLPWFSAGTSEVIYERQAKKLKIGETSAPFRSKYGFEIIKLLAIQPKQVLPLAKVKGQIGTMLANQAAQKRFADENEQLANITYADPSSLTEAANTLGLKIKTSGFFTHQGSKSGITRNAKIVNAAFSEDVLDGKNNSNVITLNPQTLVVLRIKDHQPKAQKSFGEMKMQIKQKLIQLEAQKQAHALAKKLLKQIKQNDMLNKVSQENSLDLHLFTKAGRHDTKIKPMVLAAAFKFPIPNKQQLLPAGIIKLSNGDYAIVAVTKVYQGEPSNMTPSQRKSFQQQLANGLGQLDYNLYVKQQLQQAKVKII